MYSQLLEFFKKKQDLCNDEDMNIETLNYMIRFGVHNLKVLEIQKWDVLQEKIEV